VEPKFLACEITPERIIGAGLGHAPGQRSSSQRSSAPGSFQTFAAVRANDILGRPLVIALIAVPILFQSYGIFFLA